MMTDPAARALAAVAISAAWLALYLRLALRLAAPGGQCVAGSSASSR